MTAHRIYTPEEKQYKDVLLILSRIKIYRIEESEIISEVPNKTDELVSKLNVNLNILRKTL